MQRLTRLFSNPRVATQLASLLILICAGCSNTAAGPETTAPAKPLEGTSLTVSCSDDRLRAQFEPMGRVWSYQSGATVAFSAKPMSSGDAVDLAIIPAEELGLWADRGELLPIPFNIREPGNAYQWSSILGSYKSESYAGWGSQILGLPIAGETSLIVYRADRFADPAIQAEFTKRFSRPLAAPATWEAFAELATFFSERDGAPALPPLSPPQLEELFLRVAACIDRPAGAGQSADSTASLPFTFDLTSGQPRLESKGFAAAGRWLASMKSSGWATAGGNSDPAVALNEGRAVLAVVGLADLMKLNADQKRSGRFGLARLPGTKSFVNPATGNLATVASNYVPYQAGGWLAVVRKGCKNPEAAFELLAELTGPARSRELVAAGGYAPVRDSELDPDRLQVWLGYGFSEAQTRALQDIVRSNLAGTVRNPAYGLRSPDHETLSRDLREELVRILAGTVPPEAALKAANEKWGRTTHLEWRRRAAGLN